MEFEVRTYQELRGVDYSASPAVISDEHASDMLNMYVGPDGILQKRPGWHILKQFENRKINGIHYVQYFPGTAILFVHAGTKLYYKTVKPQNVGDVNDDGEIDASDASLIMRYLNDLSDLTMDQLKRADINGDGQVTEDDAAHLLRMVVGLEIPDADFALVTKQDGTSFSLANHKSVAFEHDKILYILDGTKYNRVKPVTTEQTYNGVTFTALTSIYAEEVIGYVPTVGEGGHWEYKEPVSEMQQGATIVPSQTVTAKATSTEARATFPALAPFLSKIRVTMQVNDQALCTDAEVSVKNQAATISGLTLRNQSGSVFVEKLTINDNVKLKITQGSDVTVVEQATKTATAVSDAAEATFVANSGFADISEVTLVVNDMSVASGESFEANDDTIAMGVYTLKYSGGSVKVNNLYIGDRVTLFVKAPDEEVFTISEPGGEGNEGEWHAPEPSEEKNLLTSIVINTFRADGIHRDFYLTENNCTVAKVEIYKRTRCKDVNGVDTPTQENIDHVDEGTYNGVYYYYADVWTNVPAGSGEFYYVRQNATATNRDEGLPHTARIRFNTVPEANDDHEVNIRVRFRPAKYADKIVTEWNKINKCTIATKFGYFNNNRWFFSGNPKYPNWDFMSAVDDPTYFPADGWTRVGSDLTAIQGYLHYGTELAIIKEDNEQDATVYMRSAILTEDNDILFPVQQGAQGAGAISPYALATLRDEPLFLAKEGVYAIEGTNASQERNIPNRSYMIDTKLRKEIEKYSVGVAFGDYYLLANPTTGKCYVADARYTTIRNENRDKSYEWYVWDNVPANCFCVVGDDLYFGTIDGRVCVFHQKWTGMNKYSDGAVWQNGAYENAKAINAYFVTKRDHLGTLDFKKTMLNDGGVITLVPQERSSASITVKTDKGEWFVEDIQTDSEEPSVVVPIRHRVKNFESIETRIENSKLNEGLAIIGIQYRYAITTNRR